MKYILGAIENYTIDNIKCWVNSLERNVDNRDLEKIMLVYSGDNKLVEYLEERDFTVVLPAGGRSETGEFRYVPSTGYNICQSRFKHAARFFLNHRTIEATDTILLTDVGDVVFQADPFTHIRLNASYDNTAIFATVENILYMNEEWGKNNISHAFPKAAAGMMQHEIYNAGVMAGRGKTFVEFLLKISDQCSLSDYSNKVVPGGGGVDQAAYNILARSYLIKQWVERFPYLAYNAGTTHNPLYADRMIDEWLTHATFNANDNLVNKSGYVFPIVHQYNRYPDLNSIIRSKYT